MKVLVTGGAGFIGSHVVDQYLESGYDVVVVDDLSSGRASNLNAAATFYEVDVRSEALGEVFEKERPDVVNHHAAQIDVRRSITEPLLDAEINVLGSLRLLEYARQYEVQRVIYISTGGAVYGEPQYLPCDEDHPINPICQYGASKHIVEHYLYLYKHLYDLDYTVLRYPNVYGPRQDPHGEAGVVAIFTGQMLRGEQAHVNGDGKQERDFVYVGDCARANVLALEKARNGIYNLGWGYGTNINQIFDTLSEITHYDRPRVHRPAIAGETSRIYLSADKARRELGWEPQVRLEQGLEKTVEHFRQREVVSGGGR